MDCQDVRNYLKGQRPSAPALDDDVARHLVDCAACTAYAEELDSTGPILQKALAVQPSEEHWTRHAAKIRSGLSAYQRRRMWASWAFVSGAAAAMLAFCAWAAYSFSAAPRETVALPNDHPAQPLVQVAETASLSDRVVKLQESVRNKQLLDELEQLQISFENSGDNEGKSLAEDAELYVERILSIDVKEPEQVREIMTGIKSAGISARFEKLRDSVNEDAPAPLQDSIKLTQSTLSEAVQIADAARSEHGQ